MIPNPGPSEVSPPSPASCPGNLVIPNPPEPSVESASVVPEPAIAEVETAEPVRADDADATMDSLLALALVGTADDGPGSAIVSLEPMEVLAEPMAEPVIEGGEAPMAGSLTHPSSSEEIECKPAFASLDGQETKSPDRCKAQDLLAMSRAKLKAQMLSLGSTWWFARLFLRMCEGYFKCGATWGSCETQKLVTLQAL